MFTTCCRFAARPLAGATVTIVVAVVLLVVIVGLLAVVASNKKILCWAEKFATFQGVNFSNPAFSNPAYEHDGGMAGSADTSNALDGELYVAKHQTTCSCWVPAHVDGYRSAHTCWFV